MNREISTPIGNLLITNIISVDTSNPSVALNIWIPVINSHFQIESGDRKIIKIKNMN